MKLVVNKCFGGFGLSPLAVKRLAELEGKECYFFTNKPGDLKKFIPLSLEEASETLFFIAMDIPDFDFTSYHLKWENASSVEERKEINESWNKHTIENDCSVQRDNPLLVQVVEELGKAASRKLAELEVVEIPDGVDWEIEDYDGMESIHERHRSW